MFWINTFRICLAIVSVIQIIVSYYTPFYKWHNLYLSIPPFFLHLLNDKKNISCKTNNSYSSYCFAFNDGNMSILKWLAGK